jgi:hypothetical protein
MMIGNWMFIIGGILLFLEGLFFEVKRVEDKRPTFKRSSPALTIGEDGPICGIIYQVGPNVPRSKTITTHTQTKGREWMNNNGSGHTGKCQEGCQCDVSRMGKTTPQVEKMDEDSHDETKKG